MIYFIDKCCSLALVQNGKSYKNLQLETIISKHKFLGP